VFFFELQESSIFVPLSLAILTFSKSFTGKSTSSQQRQFVPVRKQQQNISCLLEIVTLTYWLTAEPVERNSIFDMGTAVVSSYIRSREIAFDVEGRKSCNKLSPLAFKPILLPPKN
jgi:hypothetical protein